MKFNRTYKLTVQVADLNSKEPFIEIKYPTTLNFNVSRNTYASMMSGTFSIYNLQSDTRYKLYHDRGDTGKYRRIELMAGYENEHNLSTVFIGNILSTFSYRQGMDWITQIESFSGLWDIINTNVPDTMSRPSGYKKRDVIIEIIGNMKNIKEGYITNLDDLNSRGIALSGNAFNELRDKLAQGYDLFIDNEKLYVMKKDESLPLVGDKFEISSDTGMLGTPRVQGKRVDVNMLFEPSLSINQKVSVRSEEVVLNTTDYKVIGLNHKGIISGAVCGECTTMVNLLMDTLFLKPQ